MTLYVYLAAAIAVLLAIGGAYIKGGNDREAIVKGEYATRDLADSREHQAQYIAINARYRAAEQAEAKRNQAISKGYQGKLKENENALTLARANALSTGLFDPGASGCEANRNSATTETGGGRVDPDNTGARLSPENAGLLSAQTTDFILGLASEADKVVLQLQACQAIVRLDRE